MIIPIDKGRWVNSLNDLSRKSAGLITLNGWSQNQMTGENGEMCIIAATHEAAREVEILGMSHVLREVLNRLHRAEQWNDTPGRQEGEVISFLNHLDVTEDHLVDTFGPRWEFVCYLCELFTRMDELQMGGWAEARDQNHDWDILRHMDGQLPLPVDRRERAARTAVCSAFSDRAIELGLLPMGPSVALLITKIIRPSLMERV